MKFITALFAGLLFGSGLLLSGMANPSIVLGFLDIGGAWNPALVFTMAGAVAVATPACFYARRMGRTVTGDRIDLPDRRRRVDMALVTGAVIFGLGWGMSGICPGPALLLVTGASRGAIAFIVAMLAGMLLARAIIVRSTGSRPAHVDG